MANHREPAPEDITNWEAWIATLPARVQPVARRFPPWGLYRLKTTGHRVTVYAFGEPKTEEQPVTVSVLVTGKFNLLTFERQVFGIDTDDLEPCDLPSPDEPVGVVGMGAAMPPRRPDYNVN